MSRKFVGSLLALSFVLAAQVGTAQTHLAVSKSTEFFDACDPTCSQPATIRSINQGVSGGALLSYSKSWPGLDASTNYTENFQSFHWLTPDTWTQRLDVRNNASNNNGSNRVRFEPLQVADGERAAAFAAMMNIGGSENSWGNGYMGNGEGTIRQAYLALMKPAGSMNMQWSFYPLSVRKSGGNYFVGNQESAKYTIAMSGDGHSIVFDSLVTDMAVTSGIKGPGLYLAQVPNAGGLILDPAAVELKKIVIPNSLLGCTDSEITSNISYGAASILNTYSANESDPTRKDLAVVAFTAACKAGSNLTRHVLIYNEATGQVTRVTPDVCNATPTLCNSDSPKFARNGSALYYATKYSDPGLNDMGLGNRPASGKWRIIRTDENFNSKDIVSNLASNIASEEAPEAVCPVEYNGTLGMVVLNQLKITENGQMISDRANTIYEHDNGDVVIVSTTSTNALRQLPLVVSSVPGTTRTIANGGSGIRVDPNAAMSSDRCQISIGSGTTLTYTTLATNLVPTDGQDSRFAKGQALRTLVPKCTTTMNRGRYLCVANAREY